MYGSAVAGRNINNIYWILKDLTDTVLQLTKPIEDNYCVAELYDDNETDARRIILLIFTLL